MPACPQGGMRALPVLHVSRERGEARPLQLLTDNHAHPHLLNPQT
jgi:hypothetical protein